MWEFENGCGDIFKVRRKKNKEAFGPMYDWRKLLGGHLRCLKDQVGTVANSQVYAGSRRGSRLAPIRYILKGLWLKQNRCVGHVDPQAAT